MKIAIFSDVHGNYQAHEEKYKSSIHYETEEEQKQRNSKYITKEY